jgi:hypothetical protein
MYTNEEPLRSFRTTVKTVINNLSTLENIKLEVLEETIEEAFAGYHYEGEDKVIGSDCWPNMTCEGEYALNAKVDHEDAYEFTIHVVCKDGNITVTNVL